MSKENLYLSEIESLIHVYGGTHWDWMDLEVPIRKWYIRRWNKRQEESSKDQSPSTDRPLTDAERMKFLKKSQEASSEPANMHSFLSSRRNNT